MDKIFINFEGNSETIIKELVKDKKLKNLVKKLKIARNNVCSEIDSLNNTL